MNATDELTATTKDVLGETAEMEALEAELKDIESSLGNAGDDIKPPLKKKNATIPRTPLGLGSYAISQ